MQNILVISTAVCLLTVSSLVSAVDHSSETHDLTTQQYRVESLQDDYYRLKRTNDSLQEDYDRQEEFVKQAEARLESAKATLAEKKAAVSKHQMRMKTLESKLAVEERKLNILWDQTHRKAK